uniref:Uncharacterized protein n=1 Tax=Coprothermobacter proteolyticus (strain ATCC 35245 / DSM 5265 / OCM 4 / BT) TaxID=309798 RepID=B5Y8E7_COPPD
MKYVTRLLYNKGRSKLRCRNNKELWDFLNVGDYSY